jgi:hypothetical protein
MCVHHPLDPSRSIPEKMHTIRTIQDTKIQNQTSALNLEVTAAASLQIDKVPLVQEHKRHPKNLNSSIKHKQGTNITKLGTCAQ